MSTRLAQLDTLMQSVAECQLCCNPANGISSKRLLRNLIAECPHAPRYGNIPSMYTDWASRLDSKIVVVLQDWGSCKSALDLRRYYENRIDSTTTREDAWLDTIQHRPAPSTTHKNLIHFLMRSAEIEGVCLPDDFLDRIFFTNAILCFRHGNSSGDGISLSASIANCCFKQKFLRDQLRIVQPAVVVALGERALKALAINSGMDCFIRDVRGTSPHGYREHKYFELSIRVVPAFHPAARSVNRTAGEQIEDYRFIWRALSHVHQVPTSNLASLCFPPRVPLGPGQPPYSPE